MRNRWIGWWSGRSEIDVPKAIGAVVVDGNGSDVVFDEADSVGGENGGVDIIVELANGDESLSGKTRE